MVQVALRAGAGPRGRYVVGRATFPFSVLRVKGGARRTLARV